MTKSAARKKLALVVLTGCSTLAALVLGEVFVRRAGSVDESGNIYVRTLRCYPYPLPIAAMEEKIAKYLASSDSFVMYDPNVGWAPRPSSHSTNGLYFYNEDAIRTPLCSTVVSKAPAPGSMRILIFGDSFTHGDNASFENTWGHYLEEDLKARGVPAEVLNFGVGGYGMDQAFLRWQEVGHQYGPSVVIFGLRLENMDRNINLVRPLYKGQTSLPFAKPRYILKDGQLALINVPTPRPEKLVGIVKDLPSWELARYEAWYDPAAYRENFFLKSRLISFVYTSFASRSGDAAPEGGNREALALKIIAQFKQEVEAAGAEFHVVFLPSLKDVELLKGGKKPADSFFRNLEGFASVIHPEAAFLTEKDCARTMIPAHYSTKANRAVAAAIADVVDGAPGR